MYSKKSRKIHGKIPVLESLFNKAAGLRLITFIGCYFENHNAHACINTLSISMVNLIAVSSYCWTHQYALAS